MKIYRKITMDLNGKTIYEDSYEYHGSIALCKGGVHKARREQRKQAERSYELQLAMFEEQKARLDKLDLAAESEKRSKEEEEAARNQRILSSKRMGRRSTILTGPTGLSSPAPTRRATLMTGGV